MSHPNHLTYCGRCRRRRGICTCSKLTPEQRIERAKRYEREFVQAVRSTKLAPHTFTGQSHCLDCLREYKRLSMKLYRAAERGDDATADECRQILEKAKEMKREASVRQVLKGYEACLGI
jgi:hypothetical protein